MAYDSAQLRTISMFSSSISALSASAVEMSVDRRARPAVAGEAFTERLVGVGEERFEAASASPRRAIDECMMDCHETPERAGSWASSATFQLRAVTVTDDELF